MSDMITFKRRADQVGVLVIDVPNAAQNTLVEGFAEAMERALTEAQRSDVRALVIASGKETSFVAGADLQLVRGITSESDGEAKSKEAQAAVAKLEASPIPIVAAIHGACLGGGLELALACHGRVASDDPVTKIGLPEVQLGLLPGAGGTQRLPRLIGVEQALEMMLTGKQVDGRRARKYGIVSDVVQKSILLDVAAKVALRIADEKHDGRTIADRVTELTDVKHLREFALVGNPAGRNLLFKQAEKSVRKRTGQHYPAPYKILEAVRIGLQKGLAAGLAAEARFFGELLMTDVAKRLIEIFFATTDLKKSSGSSDPTIKPMPLQLVGVVGAGLMGHGIAYVTAARAGIPVRLKDRDDEAVGQGMKAIHEIVTERADRAIANSGQTPPAMRLVSGTTEYSGLRNAQVVIEAVFEDLKLKHKILKDVEEAAGPSAIFASNTSSIPIARIAEGASHPERVIGMHYFSPVHKMPLLEIIRTKQTAEEVVVTAVDLGRRQGKTVIVVNDGVGFYTSRILGPYLNEAAWLLAEGVPIEVIDEAAKVWGFPVGPIALLDEIGLDTAAKVAKIAHEAFGDRLKPPESLERMLEDGRTGRKSHRGFYLYSDRMDRKSKAGKTAKKEGKKVDESVYELLAVRPPKKRKHDLDAIGERLALPMVLEAIRCLEEGILNNPRDGDIGAIFGLGFPPFRGGPFRYADALGISEVLRRTRHLGEQFGLRFQAPRLLEERARTGQRFYD